MRRTASMDRGDSLNTSKSRKPRINPFSLIQGGKREIVDKILQGCELGRYIKEKSIHVYYGCNLLDSPLNKMRPGEYIVVLEERDIDEFTYCPPGSDATRVSETKYYIYKDNEGDLMYFKNPFYIGNIELRSLESEKEKVKKEGVYHQIGNKLEELPYYNDKMTEELEKIGLNRIEKRIINEDFIKALEVLIGYHSSLQTTVQIKL